MTGHNFVKHYGSRDEDELYRMEQFHTDLENTLKHYIADMEEEYKEKNNIFNLVKWLEKQGEE